MNLDKHCPAMLDRDTGEQVQKPGPASQLLQWSRPEKTQFWQHMNSENEMEGVNLRDRKEKKEKKRT